MGEPSAESLVRARVWMSDYEDADWDENDLARLLDTITSLTSDLQRTREALALCENSLSCFLESTDFVVSVGGNPIVVDAMLDAARNGMSRARSLLTPPTGT